MEELKINKYNGNVDNNLKKEYLIAIKDSGFEDYIRKIQLPIEIIMRYTSHLQNTYTEYNNCINCKGLSYCTNEVKGFCEKEYVDSSRLKFEYISCKYKNKELETLKGSDNVYSYKIPKEIKNAKMKDIYLDDKNRTEVIKFLSKFIKEYDKTKKTKGLYLNGNFGCGKTYMISAAFNELSKKGVKSAIIYWPEFLRSLKESFQEDFKEKFDKIKNIELLLIDDIGAENITPWSRDEILGTILQYRMEEELTTFFTSNLNYDELEEALKMTKGKIDSLKAKRIMERIKFLTEEKNIIAINRR